VVEAGRHRGKGLQTEIEETPSQLRVDITVALALLIIAKAGRPARPNPEVCFYLGDRYVRLWEYHRVKGRSKKAKRLRAKAEFYFQGSGPWRDPPYAAAMAMPAPKRPTFTAAIGWRPRHGPPDDAA
jgi:hypothetical protein